MQAEISFASYSYRASQEEDIRSTSLSCKMQIAPAKLQDPGICMYAHVSCMSHPEKVRYG